MKIHNFEVEQDETAIVIAAVQLTSCADVKHNLSIVGHLIDKAAQQGAQLVTLPENFAAMGLTDNQKRLMAEKKGDGPLQLFLSRKANECGIWLIGGAIPIQASSADRLYNTCFVYAPDGRCVASYDKIHLFRFKNQDAAYDETQTFEAGSRVVEVDMPFARVGLSICYDIRFPEMYRSMQSPDLIVLPAAFTQTTGQAHWEILLRARAIENQCYVLAAAQTGVHPDGRCTFGHSMMVDPWGKVVASLTTEENAILMGRMSHMRIRAVRRMLPALDNRLNMAFLGNPGLTGNVN